MTVEAFYIEGAMRRNIQGILFAITLLMCSGSLPRSIQAAELEIGISILPPGLSIGVSFSLEGFFNLFSFGGRSPRTEYARFSFTHTPTPPPPPLFALSYGPEDHHTGKVLRLLYRDVRDGDRIPVRGGCGLVIEDGINGRPDGAMRFDGCGFEGYALYYPVADPRGTQLRVWKDGVKNPVLIVSRKDGTLTILEHNSPDGKDALQVFTGEPRS